MLFSCFFYLKSGNEQRIVNSAVLTACMLFETNNKCSYNDCRMAVHALKNQYNIVDLVSLTDDILFYLILIPH